ncbi:MAG: prephenate dehydratase [Candidatus Nanohaloarchaea archaeon]
MRVAFLGPEGTYTHMAADRYFEDYEEVPCSSNREAVETDAEAAVIPFENSLGGGVGESVDLLRQKDVSVTGEVRLEVNHVLASNDRMEDVEAVVSHPQALSQCSNFLRERSFETRESSSTARAAKEIEDGEAAICSRKAAEVNNLDIIEENLQDEGNNTTRFLVLNGESRERDKTSLILDPGVDRPGLLESILSCFSGHGINLAYIQSRPTKDGLGNYYFYVEAETGRESPDFRKARKCLETYADVKTLGSYEVSES